MVNTWKTILVKAGFPTKCITIDFETYFDTKYSLDKMSTIEYIKDKRFEFIGVSTFEFDQSYTKPYAAFWGGPEKTVLRIRELQEKYGQNLEYATVIMQNCFFDALILKHKFDCIPRYIVDIKWLANHLDSRASSSLKDLAKRYNCSKLKGNTEQFIGQHWDDMDQAAMAEYSKNDVNLETELFIKLLPQLTNPNIELKIMQHNVAMYLNPKFKFDFKLAKELINNMEAEKIKNVQQTGYSEKEISGTISFIKIMSDKLAKLGESIPLKFGKPTKNMIKYTGEGFIPAFAKNDLGTRRLLRHPNKEIRTLMQAKLDLKSWTSHIKRIKSMVVQARACGGRLHMPLNYYGGRTGRDSGGEGINPQNFGGKGRGIALNPLISRVRNLLCAPVGYKLGVVDAAQIEARVLAWLANEQQLVKGFANGEDVYSIFASNLFGIKVYKGSGNKDIDIKRNFGKDAILGCGFGMGASKFYDKCYENPNLTPMFDNGTYNIAFIENLIKAYRKKYKNIPRFWQQCEKAFKWVLQYKHQTVNLKDKGCPVNLIFRCKGSTVTIELPSERKLFYYHCRLKDGDIREHYGPLWGGTIVENIVQAISRDIFMQSVLKIEELYRVILRIHDEAIVLIPDKESKEGLQYCINCMASPPPYTNNLPLAADGKLMERYSK